MYVSKDSYSKKLNSNSLNYKTITKNFIFSFLFGGLIALIGEGLYYLFYNILKFNNENSNTLMVLSVILIAAILSVIGIYDKLGQIAGCGMSVPISGFSNAVISSAIEYKPEGFILGVGANTLKIAGTVLVLGVGVAGILSLVRYLILVIL